MHAFLAKQMHLSGNQFLLIHALERRHQQDLQVKEEIPVFNIVHVVLNALFDGGVSPVAVHLGPAGDAGPDLVLHHVARDLLLELLHVMGHLRPGAHQAHIPLQNVEKLG